MTQHCPHLERAQLNEKRIEAFCCYCGGTGYQLKVMGQDPEHGPYAPQVEVLGEWTWSQGCVERKMRFGRGRAEDTETGMGRDDEAERIPETV